MGFGFLLAGAMFLFDPFINIFDILPDAIGYALIAYGLSRLSDLELKVAEARRRMTSALYVALGRLAVILCSFFLEFDATLMLVFRSLLQRSKFSSSYPRSICFSKAFHMRLCAFPQRR